MGPPRRRLEATINQRPKRALEGLSQAEQLAALNDGAFRKHRQLMDYREQKREVVRAAVDRAGESPGARETLQNLLADGLLDAAAESRARAALRPGHTPAPYAGSNG